jgi:CDP-2,3-bis-(O-geranylgeranyl)-sn-glycerol synthase
LSHFIIGLSLGFGALLGDAIESFFKRQIGIPSGNSWLVFDQIDYVVGAILFSLPFVQLHTIDYIIVIATYFSLHFVVSYIGYLLGFKDKPI